MMKTLILGAVVAVLASAAYAANTSGTVTVKKGSTPVGVELTQSYTRWQASSAAVSAGAGTFDVLAPRGLTSIVGCLYTVQDVSGTHKLLRTLRSGLQVTVSNGGSATIAVSDTVVALCTLQP